MKFFVKKSVAKDIFKSLNKDKLESLKAEVIAILKKHDSDEVKKAIEYFESQESRYTHLEKSINGEWIEKAGYGLGTVRIWKGKKYKKISVKPTRWVRVFDKEDRGAKSSMTKLIHKAQACKTEEELYQFCMSNHALFQDDNGVDLPIMDKLRAAIDEQKKKVGDNLDGSKHFDTKNITKRKDLRKILEKEEKGKSEKTTAKTEVYDDDKAFEEYKKLVTKDNPTDEDFERIGELTKEHFKHSEKKWPGGAALNAEKNKDFKTRAYDGYLSTAEQIDTATKYSEKVALDYDEMLKKPVTKIQQYANSNVVDYEGGIDKFLQVMAKNTTDGISLEEAGKEFGRLINHNIARRIWDRYEKGILKINDDGYFVPADEESESEKHQNRSQAMMGNKNAYKGGYSDDEISKMKEIRDKVSDYFKKKKMDVKPNSSSFEDKLIDMAHRSKDKEVEDMCRALRSFDGKTPDEFQKQYEERIVQALHDNKDFSFEENVAAEVGQNSDYWAAHIDDRPSQGLIEMATLLKLAQDHVTEKDITDKQVRRGFSGAVQVLTDMKKVARNPEAFDEVINGYKELAAKFNPDAGKEEKKEIKEEVKAKEPETTVKETEKPVEEGNSLLKAVNKYASDKIIKNVVKNVNDMDFTLDDPLRAFMGGVYCDNGYKVATNTRMLSMIKSDYDKADEGQIIANNSMIKYNDKKIKNIQESLNSDEQKLDEVAKKQGIGTTAYKVWSDKVKEEKDEIARLQKAKETGHIDGQFPNYKRVIPSMRDEGTVPVHGFEDFNKVMKVAKTASAYAKELKKPTAIVKVGDKYFDSNLLLTSLAMAEKHGLKNVVSLKDSEFGPVEFNGENGSVVMMPMKVDEGKANIFNADTGTLEGTENLYDDDKEKNEEFLSLGEKKSKMTIAREQLESSRIESSKNELHAELDRYHELMKKNPYTPETLKDIISTWDDKRLKSALESVDMDLDKEITKAKGKLGTNSYLRGESMTHRIGDKVAFTPKENKDLLISELAKRGLSTKVEKSLFDFIEYADEAEDSEDDFFADNDATNPVLFNNTEMDVNEALDEVFGC